MDQLWQEKTTGSKTYCSCHALLGLQERRGLLMLEQQGATSCESLLIKTLQAVYSLPLFLQSGRCRRSGFLQGPEGMQSW